MIQEATKLKAVCRIAAVHKRSVGYTDNHTCTKCRGRNDFSRVTWTGNMKQKKIICMKCFCAFHLDSLKRASKKIHKKQIKK